MSTKTKTQTRFLGLLAVAGTVLAAACGGSGASPVAPPATAFMGDDGTVLSSGYGKGPGGPPSPAPSPASGTCTNECDGTGQGPGPGAGAGGPGNGPGNGPGPGDGLCGEACTGPVGPDPADIVNVLVVALQEEYKAEMLYRSVLEDAQGAMPFAVIAESEAQHVAALQNLLTRRELTPPPSDWAPSYFPRFASLALACAAGVAAETEDAAFYTPYLQRPDLPRDVRNVFTNLQRASLESHLPAFERCR